MGPVFFMILCYLYGTVSFDGGPDLKGLDDILFGHLMDTKAFTWDDVNITFLSKAV